MSLALLAKLKINKPPVPKQNIEVNIPNIEQKEGVEVKAKIIDDTKNANFDRDTFLKSFNKKRLINTLKPPALPEPALPEPALPEPALPEPSKKKTAKNTTKKTKIIIGKKKDGPLVIDEGEQQQQVEEPLPLPKTKVTMRRTKKPIINVIEGPLTMFTIGDTDIKTRLHNKNETPVIIPASSYYLNNREIFVNFTSALFNKYKKNIAAEATAPAKCPSDTDNNEFSLMTHQQIVRDYLNLYTPYRGLLLYHGLGSGKTCSSIAIAEGMKSGKQVIVLTPASLQVNYREELKKCGDDLYRKNQFWEFIPTTDAEEELINSLSKILSISVEYISNNNGAWMVNMSKPSNYDDLSNDDKLQLDKQIDQMIMHKYKFINYNGLRASKLIEMTKNNTINPFDDSVIIVDEAHNLVSRIVNKLKIKKSTIPITLYNLLLTAKNVKIVLLSGTPIINYPNEIGILFNILRGYITSWSLKLDIIEQKQINAAYFQSLFKSTILGGNILDLIEYKSSSNTLVITRNPFGFVNKPSAKDNSYAGVKLDIGERGEISDTTFIDLVTRILKKNNIKVQPANIKSTSYKALPDTLDEFKQYFIDGSGKMNNINLFKRRIIGLTSYFRSAQESLMPKYEKSNPLDFQVIKIEMSDFQFGVYEEARIQERDQEKQNAKNAKKQKPQPTDDLYEKSTSTYRIFSRAFCNFVFPKPEIKRPMPDKKVINEDVIDDVTMNEKINRDESFDDGDGEGEGDGDGEGAATEGEGAAPSLSYRERINKALKALEENGDKYLTPSGLEQYSPKFLHILENIQDVNHVGIHLVYSQFRSLEGIGILKLILEANGFAQFKIKKVGESWNLNIPEEDAGKPMFALYTGTETTEEKEIVRNVINNAWKYVPESIVKKIKEISSDNTMGKIIKVLMITSSGAEGISLKNVRYVHITEPYWHPVRMEQVIGRARRICSHQSLPEELRTVNVFLYLMTLSEKQLKGDETKELRLKDKSRKDDKTPVTTDETLYEIASIKEEISTNLLTAVKEASIDCIFHQNPGSKEKLKCFTFTSNDPSKIAYTPSLANDTTDTIAEINKKKIEWKAKVIETPDGIKYALNEKTNELYDLDSYKNGNPVKVGDFIKDSKTGRAEIKFM